MISYNVEAGVARITFDNAAARVNVLNTVTVDAFEAAFRKAESDPAVSGIVIDSAKSNFIVGADLGELTALIDKAAIREFAARQQQLFRSVEVCEKPVAVVVSGLALGGGFELVMACQHRVLCRNERTRVGLPESTLGLIPGAGGTQRLPRLVGVDQALKLLSSGDTVDAEQALAMGIATELADDDAALAAAQARVNKGEAIPRPWDQKGYSLDLNPKTEAGRSYFMAKNAEFMKRFGENYPAQTAILRCVYEAAITPSIDVGLRRELACFVDVVTSPQATAMIRTRFTHTKAAKNLAMRPTEESKRAFETVAVIGAGMMGAGIAASCAMTGHTVYLLDRNLEMAEKGKAYSETAFGKLVKKGTMTAEESQQCLANIIPTVSYDDLNEVQMVVEAVFEDRALKASVYESLDAVIPEDAVIASNTSTLPISGLATTLNAPSRFIGLHFFSPVDRMQLVEVICGEQTSSKTLAWSLDFVRSIAKLPILAGDKRGFYTSRVFSTYVQEGMAMLGEGVEPALIDNCGRLAGMPVGPLTVADEVSEELVYNIEMQAKADLGDAFIEKVGLDVVEALVTRLDRLGKKVGRGIYDYPEGGTKVLWPELADHFPVNAEQPSPDEVQRRLLYVQSVETVRCMEEGVLTSAADADIGATLGWNFAHHTGGPIGLIESVGVAKFVDECRELAERHGPRFAPPALLCQMAAAGESFYKG